MRSAPGSRGCRCDRASPDSRLLHVISVRATELMETLTMPPDGTDLRAWWPTTQSLDLVEGSIETVAAAIEVELSRFAAPDKITTSWLGFRTLGEAFASAPCFINVVSYTVVLPTRSNWAVIWHNSFTCGGYDSLCRCLTTRHNLTTIHWSAHDDWTTTQSGACFIHRRNEGSQLIERSVEVWQEDKRWGFRAFGPVLPEEQPADYTARRMRDRLNEKSLIALLGRLGAEPWSESFYDLAHRKTFVLSRPVPPKASVRAAEEFLRPIP